MRRNRLFVVTLAACAAAAFLPSGAAAKGGKSSGGTQVDLHGWCCRNCAVSQSTRNSCVGKGGTFHLSRPAAKASCDSLERWCCDGGSLIEATRAECDQKKGTFFCDEDEAGKKCVATAKPAGKKGKTSPALSLLPGKKVTDTAGESPGKVGKGPAPTLVPAALPSRGWCSAAGMVLQISEAQCTKKKGKFFPMAQKKGALAHSLTLKKTPGAPGQPGGAGKMRAVKAAPEALTKTERGMKAGPGTFGASIPPRATAQKESTAARAGPAMARRPARPVGAGAQASTLVQRIVFDTPGRNDAYNWGDTITVRYRINLLDEEPGDVTFTFRDPERRGLATATHYYDAPVLESLADIESIEPATGGFVHLEEGGGDEEDPGPGTFQWTLPERGGRMYGHGFTIAAAKGPHRGVSGKFTMIKDCSSDLMSVSIQPPQHILRRGETVTVAFSLCGWGGLTEDGPPVYIRDSSSPWSEVSGWARPSHRITEISGDRVRGAMRVTVPRDYPRGEGQVITLVYGGGIVSTLPFEVQNEIGRDDVELADLFHAPGGDVVARLSVGGGLDGSVLPVRVNTVTTLHVVEEGESDIVVGSQPYWFFPLGLRDSSCSEEWDVELDPRGEIDEGNEGNNRLTRRFSYLEGGGGTAWLGIAAGASQRVNYIPCDCDGGYSATGGCDTVLYVKSCADGTVDLDDAVTVTHAGTRQRGGGALGTEEFSEAVPFEIRTAYTMEDDSTMEVEDIKVIMVRYGDYGTYSDSTLTFSFGPPLRGWSGLTNPYVVDLNFGEMDHFGSGRCEY